ncbi:MAG: hypothetical protein PHT02_00180 [Tissierellia bacterium]|nr:hypothetical protein [Tissierellia bacterium]
MSSSLKFENIESNLVNLFTLLYFNQNISKYVYYLVDDPLSITEDVPVDLKDEGYYLLTVFDNSIPQIEKIRIFLNPYSGNLKKIGTGEILYQMDIIVPNTKWILNGMGQIRAFRIANEFNKMVDGKPVAGIGSVCIEGFRTFKVNDTYSGVSLFISTSALTTKSGV